MTHLVVGGDGLVGRALCGRLEHARIDFEATSRRSGPRFKSHYLDLRNPPRSFTARFAFDVVYLVAAVPKFAECERDPSTWAVNVDAPIALARLFASAFKVFISSDAVEFAGHTAYGRQKAHAEAFMHTVDAAIVRPTRIIPEQAHLFADFLIEVAQARRPGVVHWKWTGPLPDAQPEGVTLDVR